MNNSENSKKTGSDEDILEVARKRFHQAEEAWDDIRRDALDDLKFSNGEQWPDHILRSRQQENRPSLTINRMGQFIRQVTNDQRQNRPSIKVSPVDDMADIETARIIQGLIRYIENSSSAENAYDTAFDSAARCGYGFFRIVTDYCDPKSFDQDIKIKRIADRFSAFLDPHFQEPDGSDAAWGTVFERMTPEEFKAHYPNAELTGMHDWSLVSSECKDWITDDSVRVAEYFYKEFVPTQICLLSNGQVVEKSELPEELPPGLFVEAERSTVLVKVKWIKHNGLEILEETDWPVPHIPIIPVLGEELVIEGKRTLTSVIRHAKDSQRMYNYWKSSETETIALAPKAPWIGYEGQFEGHPEWDTANLRNYSKLEVKRYDENGQPYPLPQRNVFEPPVQAITNASLYAADDLKATTGIYDAAMGAQSNEVSGKAINARRGQSQVSNFHFFDNLGKSLKYAGRIVVDLIPFVYDTARAAKIIGDDGNEEVIKINQPIKYKGETRIFDLSVGKYDVTVDSGPSFETKRQEAVASMADLTGKYPQLMQVAGDIMIKNMDWPGAQEIADRFKKTLPPGLADDPKDQKPLPPEVQVQMQQQMQMIEQLTQQLNLSNQEREQKELELKSKERIEMAKLETQAAIELAKLESKEAILSLQTQIAELDRRQRQLGFNQPFETDLNQEMGPDQPQVLDEQQPTGGYPPGTSMGD